MKCLSICQPWASLVILGAKRYETRSWQTHYRGRIAIHAGRKYPPAARALCREVPFCNHLPNADLPTGVLLGTVLLEDCVPTADLAEKWVGSDEWSFGDFKLGRWAWRLSDPRPLETPFPCLGRLSLYDIAWEPDAA